MLSDLHSHHVMKRWQRYLVLCSTDVVASGTSRKLVAYKSSWVLVALVAFPICHAGHPMVEVFPRVHEALGSSPITAKVVNFYLDDAAN